MAQTLTSILVHIVFSTKNREPLIPESVEADLFAYIGGICRGSGCALLAAGAAADHIHLLVSLAKTARVSDLLLEIKRDTSSWIKQKAPGLGGFRWQEGYGAFSVGRSQVESLHRYFARQKSHHQRMSFQEELLALLNRYQVEYDDRYIWS